jgi:hypothetical protein
MPSVRLRPRPAPLQQPRQLAGVAALAAIAVLLFVPVFVLLRDPGFVRHVTFSNPTPYQLEVLVSGPKSDGWLDLGAVPRESDITVDEVAQQGSKWTFRFTSGGVFAAEMDLTRSDLEHGNWRIAIPPGIADSLQSQGVSPSAH